LELSELITDARFSENVERVKTRTELQEIIQGIISRFDSATILEFMHQKFVPVGIIRNLEEVFETSESEQLIRTENIDQIETKRVSQIAFQLKP
jgi:crotonobetainyl-CoA:carnitine CoA-transferase CaiB-like acyl-CoA transferase